MPRTMTIEKTVFKFDELDDSAKEKALNYFRESACDDSYWHECIYEDCATIFDILGITSQRAVKLMNGTSRYEPDISFSGFWSQGDGASFEGSYYFKAGCSKAIRQHAPLDKELHAIADGLTAIARRYFYSLSASLDRRSHHYSHENTISIDVESERREVTPEDSDSVAELMRDLMRWIYSYLEKEYEYQTSDETLRENIIANDYDFDESGNLE